MLAALMIASFDNIILGGYSDVSTNCQEVVEAMSFLRKQSIPKLFPGANENTELKVLKARTQVVAGINVELTLLVGNKEFIVTIYNRFGNLSITSIKEH